MKLLHIIETLGSGGAERLLVNILPELIRQGVDVEVVALSPPYDLKANLEQEGVTVHCLPRRHKWNLLSAAYQLSNLAQERRANGLHAHLYFPTIITALAKILRFWRGVTFVTFHNLAYAGANKQTWKLAIRLRIARILVNWGIDSTQAVSAATATHYSDVYKLKKVDVLHNGIDMATINSINEVQGDSIVLPGRLVPEKGHLILIAALKKLDKKCPPVIFAGGGPLRSKVEMEIQNLGLTVIITGSINHNDMLTTIARARLVVIPSLYEGFGLTALEAIALGRPVVGTTAGGIPEVLGNLGLTVPPGDSDALALAIGAALSDNAWCTAQKKAGPRRAERFETKTIASQQIKLYRQVFKEKGFRP